MQERVCKGVAGVYADEIIKLELAHTPKGPEIRARLKAYDTRTMILMAIVVVETLEGVPRQAIVADENIGPGVYHRAIEGLNFIQGACRIQGDQTEPETPSSAASQ